MWSDKETTEDLLGYTVHASLLKSVVTNEKNLPITVGLYGDWGLGKTSILRILEKQLKDDDDTVVIYFDGWSFESFDDAKMALIQGIVDALEKEERFSAKVGDAIGELKAAFVKIRKSINWMRVLRIAAKTIIPIATAQSTGGASLIIPLLINAFKENKDNLVDVLTNDNAADFLKNAIGEENEEEKYAAVREFRRDFEDLIKKSKQGRVVVLIDDLDRCLPRHIIENLEAIKLFLNVPQTAFVIAADSYIVSNAIRSEYKEIIEAATKDRPNLGDSYMEKFIQLPYRIPALSPKEVETYVTLLFCQSILDEDSFKKVRDDFEKFAASNKFDRYGWQSIQKVLENSIPDGLEETIGFITRFSALIGNSLKWNPRLIKRFLNAYEMRIGLLRQSGIVDSKSRFALLKLMLVEQKHENQFKQLGSWVMGTVGVAPELLAVESYAEGKTKELGEYKDWNITELLKLIASDPKFSEVDMRELFWVSRDNIVEQMSGLSLISSRVRNVFNCVYNAASDNIRENVCKEKITIMPESDLGELFDLIDAKILTDPAQKDSYSVYYFCIKNEINNAYKRLLEVLGRIDTRKIPFSLGNKFKDILQKYSQDAKLRKLLEKNSRLMRSIDG